MEQCWCEWLVKITKFFLCIAEFLIYNFSDDRIPTSSQRTGHMVEEQNSSIASNRAGIAALTSNGHHSCMETDDAHDFSPSSIEEIPVPKKDSIETIQIDSSDDEEVEYIFMW
jgi:hypothetical protein